MPRPWISLALVIALIAAAVSLLDSPSRVLQPDTADQTAEATQMTAFLTGVRSTQYNVAGAVEYRFSTPRMSHFQPNPEEFSAEDYTRIESPVFTFFQQNASPWFLRADQGRSTEEGELVILEDDVRAWQELPEGGEAVLTTSRLLIRPESQVAESDQFVMIRQPRVISEGVGIRADLEQETFSILSQGRTVYEPNP